MNFGHLTTGAPPRRGMMIAIEGIDGSGKSSLLPRLAKRIELFEGGELPFVTHEPGSSMEPQIRELFKSGGELPSAEAMAVLFTADRILHVRDLVEPKLAAGRHVLCDRYTWSTMVYQQAHGCELDLLSSLCAVPPSPDFTLWLDLDPAIARARLQARSELDAYEGDLLKQIRMREMYRNLFVNSTPGSVGRVDASGSRDEIVDTAMLALTKNRIVG